MDIFVAAGLSACNWPFCWQPNHFPLKSHSYCSCCFSDLHVGGVEGVSRSAVCRKQTWICHCERGMLCDLSVGSALLAVLLTLCPCLWKGAGKQVKILVNNQFLTCQINFSHSRSRTEESLVSSRKRISFFASVFVACHEGTRRFFFPLRMFCTWTIKCRLHPNKNSK